ncbi:FecR domain-containing protein [Pantoea sp. 18069]|uniref:FecR domain-containing protein n=1 Tax=Pantoea sp. 18069 TaxID=2681415 RepID=UPI00135840BB|nr:FecR domain-containing protein [Pantoea sp. 18069]
MLPRPAAAQSLPVRQAFLWMARLQSGSADARMHRAFEQWRSAHPEHERAWLRAQEVGQALQADFRALSGGAGQASFDALQTGAQRLSRRRLLAKLSIGAATVAPVAWLTHEIAPWQRLSADFATAKGERRTVTLPDGTALSLNTDSAVQLRFDGLQRLLVLTRGEIALRSGADAAASTWRPLRVQTRDGLFEALGTRFVVRLAPAFSLLVVEEGAVAMQPAQAAPDDGRTVARAGAIYRLSASGAVPADTGGLDPTGWTDGALVLRDMRLADFLTEVGRYRRGHVGCDPRAAALRLSGVYRLDDTERLLAVLPSVLPVRIDYRTRFWVQVSMR